MSKTLPLQPFIRAKLVHVFIAVKPSPLSQKSLGLIKASASVRASVCDLSAMFTTTSALPITCFHYISRRRVQWAKWRDVTSSRLCVMCVWQLNNEHYAVSLPLTTITSPFRSLAHSVDTTVTSPLHNEIQPSFPSLFTLISCLL